MMAAKLEERYLRIYCPTHKISFTAADAGSIICDGGGEALAQNFPYERAWEYCCDCQSLWPSNLSKGGKAAEQCLVCSREIKRRYVCDQCKIVSVESDESARRKAFTISKGVVEPQCPGCLKNSARVAVWGHECSEAGVEFTTAHDSCPFCDEQIADRPSFPMLAAEYLAKIKARKIRCRLDASNNLLVENENGDYMLLPGGNGTNLSIVLPALTRFSNKRDYYDYKDYYDCEEPAAGEIFIIYPAIADKLEAGWQLREVGRLNVKKDETHVEPATVEIQPEPSVPQIVCPNCESVAQPEHIFCKECGHPLREREATVDSEQTTFQTNEQDFNPTVSTPRQSKKWPGLILAVAACAALALIIVAVMKRSGSSSSSGSVESKLEGSISRGNLVSPSGESAYDYYQQLKREGASRSALSKFESRLLPLLTSRPQEMINSVAKPDGRDSTPAEWEEAGKLLSWASEIKANDSSLAARAEYCKGRAAFLSRRVDDALNHWQSAGDLDRSWALPFSDLGYIYLKDKSYRDLLRAREMFAMAISRDKNWAVPHLYTADSYYLQKFYEDARPFYEEAARLAPQWARAHAALGNLAKMRGKNYREQGNYDLAREEYNTAQQELEQALELLSKSSVSSDHTGIDDDLSDVRRGLQELDGVEE